MKNGKISKKKKTKFSKSCKKVGNGWKRVLKNVLRCLKVFFRFFGSVAVYLRGACRGVVGGEKSKNSENYRHFRKVVKWSEMYRKVI